MSKLFFLKTNDGRYATIENNQASFTKRLSYARFVRTAKDAETKKLELEFLLNTDLTIFESTEEEFMMELSLITTQAIIVGELYKHLMEGVNYNLPTISQVNKNLKNVLKNSIEHMKKVTVGFKDFERTHEDVTYQVSGNFQETIQLLSEIPLEELSELNAVLRGFKADKKSLIGISTKVTKNLKSCTKKNKETDY